MLFITVYLCSIIRPEDVRARFLLYHPEQDYLLPPGVHDALGPEHLCYLGHVLMENRNGLAVQTQLTQAKPYKEGLLCHYWEFTRRRKLEGGCRRTVGVRGNFDCRTRV